MNRLYCCVVWGVLMITLSACGEAQQSTELPEENKETVVVAVGVQSVFAVQEAASGDPPVVFVDPGQESIPPADQPER